SRLFPSARCSATCWPKRPRDLPPPTRQRALTARSFASQDRSRASSVEARCAVPAGAMTFPVKLLAPGEEVYLDSRPNWSYLFWPSVLTVLVLAGCVAVVVLWASAP